MSQVFFLIFSTYRTNNLYLQTFSSTTQSKHGVQSEQPGARLSNSTCSETSTPSSTSSTPNYPPTPPTHPTPAKAMTTTTSHTPNPEPPPPARTDPSRHYGSCRCAAYSPTSKVGLGYATIRHLRRARKLIPRVGTMSFLCGRMHLGNRRWHGKMGRVRVMRGDRVKGR